MRIGLSPPFEKAHIPSPLHTPASLPGTSWVVKENRLPENADVERPLFNSAIDRFGSRGGYSDIPQVPLIRPVLGSPLTHSV